MTNKTEQKFCFVVGPIGIEGTEVRKHADMLLNAVIREVLAHPPFALRVKRADEDADPGMIGDRVLTDVVRADLVVADLTDLNPNAFYELGIRHAAQKPTIHIARQGTQLPFDNVAHRTIFVDVTDWTSIMTARGLLAKMAEAALAPDYKVNNPVTQANASFRMLSSSDPTEQLLGTLQARVEALESLPKSTRMRRMDARNDQYASDLMMESFREELKDRLATVEEPEDANRTVLSAATSFGIHIDQIITGDDNVRIYLGNGRVMSLPFSPA